MSAGLAATDVLWPRAPRRGPVRAGQAFFAWQTLTAPHSAHVCAESDPLPTASETLTMERDARDLKMPKFKRCKIARSQLVVLTQHFGALRHPVGHAAALSARFDDAGQALPRRP